MHTHTAHLEQTRSNKDQWQVFMSQLFRRAKVLNSGFQVLIDLYAFQKYLGKAIADKADP
jgi:hypothetical protein